MVYLHARVYQLILFEVETISDMINLLDPSRIHFTTDNSCELTLGGRYGLPLGNKRPT